MYFTLGAKATGYAATYACQNCTIPKGWFDTSFEPVVRCLYECPGWPFSGMAVSNKEIATERDLAVGEPEAVNHAKEALEAGEPWHRALLSAMGLWTLPYEVHQGRQFNYLIAGEAFDWLLLAERLCLSLDGAIPPDHRERLLFHGKLPEEVGDEEFRDLLGANKFRGYLNFWYGVVVEEALQLAVEEDVRKRQIARCYPDSEDLIEEAYQHLYGETRTELLADFRRREGLGQEGPLSLANLKEFTYGLHKLRLEKWDPARVASDTQRGIRKLRQLEQAAGLVK